MIRVGTIINVMKAYETYQVKLQQYKENRDKAITPSEQKYWNDTVKMTEEEINEFMEVIIPDPTPKLDITV